MYIVMPIYICNIYYVQYTCILQYHYRNKYTLYNVHSVNYVYCIPLMYRIVYELVTSKITVIIVVIEYITLC